MEGLLKLNWLWEIKGKAYLYQTDIRNTVTETYQYNIRGYEDRATQ